MLCETKPSGLPAEHLHELLVHDLDDCLGGIQGSRKVDSGSALAYALGENRDRRECNIRFQQRGTNFLDGAFDVGVRELSSAAQRLERVAQSIRKLPEHGVNPSRRR